jgi:hypothetical protein
VLLAEHAIFHVTVLLCYFSIIFWEVILFFFKNEVVFCVCFV